jgi:hypothetical protein
MPWWVVAAIGVVVAVASVVALLRLRAKQRRHGGYVRVAPGVEPAGPLLHSQIEASLTSPPRDPIRGLLAWANANGRLGPEVDDIRQQLRTLQTYVLDLDKRYVRREEAAWLSLETTGLVIAIATGTAAVLWALIDLAK